MVTGALGANGLVLIKLVLCFQSMVLGALGRNGLVLIKLVDGNWGPWSEWSCND